MTTRDFVDFVPRGLPRARAVAVVLALAATGFLFLYLTLEGAPWYAYLSLVAVVALLLAAALLSHFNAQFFRYADMDYEGVVVKNFHVETHDGLRLRCYEYRREDVDEDTPLPTILSFHGWGAHHRTHDLYALPLIRTRGWRYFTLDQRGCAGQPGDKSDHAILEDARRFLDAVLSRPNIDVNRTGCLGTSMGAALALGVAYRDPRIKVIAAMAAPSDFRLTIEEMPRCSKLMFKLGGFKLDMDEEEVSRLSAASGFQPEGVELADGRVAANADRVILFHCRDDRLVTYSNLPLTAEKLRLPPENAITFPRGDHWLVADETEVAIRIADFFTKHIGS
ncbi:MAG: alpha/beta hydrolase family protein [Promethearchaeota archaeon]